VPITFNGPITIPANPPTVIVNGIAVNPGVAGNIPTLDFSEACCAPNNEIFVKNTAFTGGQDAQTKVQQGDINGAANQIVTTQTPVQQAQLRAKIQSNERMVDNSQQCKPNTTASQKAGDIAKTVTVQVTVTCSAEIYDYTGLKTLVSGLLSKQARNDPNVGANYQMQNPFTLNIASATVADAGTGRVTIQGTAQSMWVYQFAASQLTQLAKLIVGMSETNAQKLLLQQPGVAAVQFSLPGTLPGDAGLIQVKAGAAP
jgi:hypothetical protein